MESSEGYKNIQRKIKDIEQELSLCTQTITQCEQSGKDVEKEIEDHFSKCINALAERKAVLLREAAQKVTQQKILIEDTRVKLETSFDVFKHTLKAGSASYTISPDAAEMIWKSIAAMPVLHVSPVRVITQLPLTFFNVIHSHGEVGDTRRFSKAGMVTTLAGSMQGLKDGKGVNAWFDHPWGTCFNPHDQCLYVCDYNNNAIRRLTMQGDASTFATVKCPSGIVINYKEHSFYVASYGAHTVVKITSSGTVSPFAGSEQAGSADGVGSKACFSHPMDITIDQRTGNLFVCNQTSHSIKKITPHGEVSTLAGSQGGFADGNGKAARFNRPFGICFDENSQSLLVCDSGNSKLRKVQLNGEVSTLCPVSSPASVVITSNQTILVSSSAHVLHKVTYQGLQKYKVEVLAGNSGRAARVDGTPDECCFSSPRGLAVHEADHSCFIVEAQSHAIRKVSFAN